MSLQQENNNRIKKLNEDQQSDLKKKLILWRILSFFVINVVALFTVGVVFGILGWLLLMILLLDEYLVKLALDSIERKGS